MKTLIRLVALVVLIFVGKAIFSAINQSAPVDRQPVAAPARVVQKATAQPVATPPPPVATPTAPVDELAAKLDTAIAEETTARERLEALKSDATAKLSAMLEYAVAKSEAATCEAKVKQLRAASSPELPQASQEWIAAKARVSRLEAAAINTLEIKAASDAFATATNNVAAAKSQIVMREREKNKPVAKVAEPPHDDLSLFVSRFGPPDSDTNSANEQPRPLIVTRFIVYKNENLRIVYRPDAPVGSPPPYENWKLMGFQNNETNAVVTPDRAVELLSARDTKRAAN